MVRRGLGETAYIKVRWVVEADGSETIERSVVECDGRGGHENPTWFLRLDLQRPGNVCLDVRKGKSIVLGDLGDLLFLARSDRTRQFFTPVLNHDTHLRRSLVLQIPHFTHPRHLPTLLSSL
jgi:hypothetical protein